MRKPSQILYLAIPLAVAAHWMSWNPTLTFVFAALGTIPAAGLMGQATEELAARSGQGIGGLLNVTFGNAPELIIALFALNAGLYEVVKASLAGSIISNVLLVLGASMLAGGLSKHSRNGTQKFNRITAGAQSGMLLLAAAALAMPAIHSMVSGSGLPRVGQIVAPSADMQTLTLVVCGVLLLVYAAGLVFSLITHSKLFNPEEDMQQDGWSVKKSVGVLALAGGLVALMSELLVGSIEHTAHGIGLSQFFIGAVVVALVGNAAEHWVAVSAARKDQMDLSVNIAVGSAAQVALFVVPVLFLASWVVGPGPMNLVFNGYELAAILLAAIISVTVTGKGRSNWFEGLQLIAVYTIVAITFFFA